MWSERACFVSTRKAEPGKLGRPMRLLPLLSTALGAALLSPPLQATDCDPAGGVSPCLDAEALWLASGRANFVAIEPTAVVHAGKVGVVLGTSYAHKPVVLNVPSPDPDGRDINVVRHLVTTTLITGYAPVTGLEVTLSTPFTPAQDGAGTEAVASRVSAPLPGTAVRDPRVGAAYSLRLSPVGSMRAQADVVVPLGDEHLLAGDAGLGLSPRVTFGADLGSAELAGSVGARLRRSVPFASARWGSELTSALGGAVHILGQQHLSVALEGHLRSSLVDQPEGGVLAPAEWLLSVRSAPFSDPGLVLQLGGGTAVPLSSGDRDGEPQAFAGLTAPRLRGVFAVRYAPGASR